MTQEAHEPPRTPGLARWTLIGLATVALVLLIVDQRDHVLGLLPYLVLLACPLMHVFMHRGHRHHRPSRGSNDDSPPSP